MQLDPISYFIEYKEIIIVFFNSNFLIQSLVFLVVFWVSIYIFYIPLSFLKKNYLWQLLGLSNLIIILSFSFNYFYFFNISLNKSILFTSIILLYILEILVLKFLKAEINLNIKFNKRVFLLYIAIFLLLSSASFDLNTNSFFVPGYEVNHDSINILSSVSYLENRNLENETAMQTRELVDIYPMGGSMFVIYFSGLLNIDPYFIYILLINSTLLLTLFVIYEFTKSYIVSIVSIFSFLSISAVNASVLGSTIVVPFIVYIFLLLFKIRKKVTRENLYLLTILIFASASLYGYFPLVYIAVFSLFTGTIVYLAFSSIFLLLNPHFVFSTFRMLFENFYSGEVERNLFLGMSGNQNSFTHILKTFSLWFSHPNYIINEIKTFNLIFLVIIIYLIYKIFKSNNLLVKKTFFTFTGLLFVAYFLTNSYYQFYKVSYQFSFFIPLMIFLIVKKSFIKNIIFTLMILSGLLTLNLTGVNVSNTNYDLYTNANAMCVDKSIDIYSRSEWARYFLFNCENVNYKIDRRSYENMTVLLNENNISSIPFSCNNLKLSLPNQLLSNNNIIIDECFKFDSENYLISNQFNSFTYYEKK